MALHYYLMPNLSFYLIFIKKIKIFYNSNFWKLQVALTLHGFTLHGPHFTRGLSLCQMNSLYVMPYTISSLYTIKKHYLSNVGTVFHFTRISLYTIYSERQKSCKVRATCTTTKHKYVPMMSLHLYIYKIPHI